MTFANIVLVLAGTLTALIAGLFFAFSFAVNRGLARLGDAPYLAAMQSINLVIVNPVFLVSFLGPVLLIPLAVVLRVGEPGFGALVAAAIAYVFFGFGVTVGRNVPLNNRLAAVDLVAASGEELAQVRGWFERPWNAWHAVRTAATTVAVALLFVAACAA